MSAGAFVISKYEANDDGIHLIKVQPETVAATIDEVANAAPAGAIDSPFAAEVNRGARAYGLRPRRVTVKFEDSPPTGYKPYTTLTIPILSKTVFAGIEGGDPVAYAGGTGEVSTKTGEDINPGLA